MAERKDLLAEFETKYSSISKKMLDKGGTFDTQIDLVKEKFNDFSLTTEQEAEILTKMFIEVSLAYNKDAISATTALLKQEASEPNQLAQADATIRQAQGYDDNMLIKVSEQKSSVASFAVNAGSSSAQSAIDSMNATMAVLEGRVQSIDGEATCPVLPTPTPIPANLGVDNITDNAMEISWSTVTNASTYEVFVDGISITTTGQSIFILSSLQPSTKYAINVTATVNGIVSNLSTTVIGATIAIP